MGSSRGTGKWQNSIIKIKKHEPNLIAWGEKEVYGYFSKHVILFDVCELSERPIRAGQQREQREVEIAAPGLALLWLMASKRRFWLES